MGRKQTAGTFGCCGKWGARSLVPRIAEKLRGRTGILANSRRAKGVHGMGTGALKKAVWGFLKDHPAVESLRLAERNQGGAGATIVEFKK